MKAIVSFDPYGNSGVPHEEDDLVIEAKRFLFTDTITE